MQILTEEQKRKMTKSGKFVPPRHTIRDIWLGILDVFVGILTLGSGCVRQRNRRGEPMHWHGIIR